MEGKHSAADMFPVVTGRSCLLLRGRPDMLDMAVVDSVYHRLLSGYRETLIMTAFGTKYPLSAISALQLIFHLNISFGRTL